MFVNEHSWFDTKYAAIFWDFHKIMTQVEIIWIKCYPSIEMKSIFEIISIIPIEQLQFCVLWWMKDPSEALEFEIQPKPTCLRTSFIFVSKSSSLYSVRIAIFCR